MIRYSERKKWTKLPISLLYGRSDFQLLNNLPSVVTIYPNMNSISTKTNPGHCETLEWKKMFGSVENGKKSIMQTNIPLEPWIQLDLGEELMVVLVSSEVHSKY